MSEDVVFDQLAAVLPVRDLDSAPEGYRSLGFEAFAYKGPERYGFAERGNVHLHLSE